MMQQHPFGQPEVGTSQFYMIRCVFAMAHADGAVSAEERAYADTLIDRMPFNVEQIAILHKDLHSPQDVSDLMRYINEPKFRGQVIYFARLMAFKDGNLHPDEDQLLHYLHLSVTQNLDMDAIRAQVRDEVQKELMEHDTGIDSVRPSSGLSGILDRFLVFCGIDLMDE